MEATAGKSCAACAETFAKSSTADGWTHAPSRRQRATIAATWPKNRFLAGRMFFDRCIPSGWNSRSAAGFGRECWSGQVLDEHHLVAYGIVEQLIGKVARHENTEAAGPDAFFAAHQDVAKRFVFVIRHGCVIKLVKGESLPRVAN